MTTGKKSDKLKSWLDPSVSRRKFLKTSGTLAASAAVGSTFVKVKKAEAVTTGELSPDPIEQDANIVYSVCLQCHGGCGIRVKVVNDVVVKIDGNPYHPNSMEVGKRLAYSTTRANSISTVGSVCVKGQAGVQTINNPYRLLHPLKRASGTSRGEGKWEVVTLDTACAEVATQIEPYFQKTVADTSLTPAAAAAASDAANYIDTNFPEFGGKANQVIFSPGRFEHGQKEFTDRLFRYGFGTQNYRHDHTSICETSHHVAYAHATEDGKDHLKPDIVNSRYCIAWGANPLEADFPMQAISRKFMKFKKAGGKLVVIDPRFSNSAAVADQWIPVQPGQDAALAMGMIKYIIDNSLYDASYLENPNATAALADVEKTYCDATYIVDTSQNSGSGAFLLNATKYRVIDQTAGTLKDYDDATLNAGILDPTDAEITAAGLTVGTHKTVFQLLQAEADKKTVAQWAAVADPDGQVITETLINNLAADFTSYGKKAGIELYRGAVQHTNGFYTALAIIALNTLIGNYDWKGGMAPGGSHWHEVDDKAAGMINLKSDVGTGKQTANGIQITRVGSEYAGDAPNLFAQDGYPAKRPWFPFAAFGNYQEVIPSIGDQYPYTAKVLLSYWNNMPYSTPAIRDTAIEILKDTTKLPYHVCFDYEMGEMASLADLVIPDGCYLERWSTPHYAPSILTKGSGFRQPTVGSYGNTKKAWEFPYAHPLSSDIQMVEDIIMTIAHKVEALTGVTWPGFGADPFSGSDSDTAGKTLNNAYEWYDLILSNLRIESGLPADNQELRDKGGVFEDDSGAYSGNYMGHTWGKRAHLYVGFIPTSHTYSSKALVATLDSQTGANHTGLPTYVDPEQDIMGNSFASEDSGAANGVFKILTYKPVFHAQGRTIINPWLNELMPENAVEMNAADASALGLKTGDKVKVTSTNSLAAASMGGSSDSFYANKAKIRVTQGIRRGVVAVAHSYGHWEMSSKSRTVDGAAVAGDPSRGAGISSSPVTRQDTSVNNKTTNPAAYPAALQDSVGGSVSFYDSYVKIEKI